MHMCILHSFQELSFCICVSDPKFGCSPEHMVTPHDSSAPGHPQLLGDCKFTQLWNMLQKQTRSLSKCARIMHVTTSYLRNCMCTCRLFQYTCCTLLAFLATFALVHGDKSSSVLMEPAHCMLIAMYAITCPNTECK